MPETLDYHLATHPGHVAAVWSDQTGTEVTWECECSASGHHRVSLIGMFPDE